MPIGSTGKKYSYDAAGKAQYRKDEAALKHSRTGPVTRRPVVPARQTPAATVRRRPS